MRKSASATEAPPRLAGLETLRAAAALAVVCLHVAAAELGRQVPGSPDWQAANLLDAATRWCVPVFVMITGALLLGRSDPPGRFIARRLLRLAPPLLFWSLAYTLLGAAIRPGWTPQEGLFALLRGAPWYHLWYLFMLPGLYLLTPWLQGLLRARRVPRPFFVPLAIGATCLVWWLPPAPSAWLRAPAFVVSYLAGYLLLEAWRGGKGPARLSAGFWGLCWGIATLAIALGAGGFLPLPGSGGLAVAYDYASPVVLLQAVAVFMLGLQLRASLLARLAPCGFAIYLLHPALLMVLEPLWGSPGGLLGLCAQALAGCLASLFAAMLLLRLPWAARLLI